MRAEVPAREVYPNAPVVLVALEVRHPSSSLTATEVGSIKAALNDRVPIARTVETQEISGVMQTDAPLTPPRVRSDTFPRFLSRDKGTSVTVRRDSIVIETTRYQGWELLRQLIASVFEAREDIGGVDGVERVGLRYINEIRTPEASGHAWGAWIDPSMIGPADVGKDFSLTATQWQGLTQFSRDQQRAIVLRHAAMQGYAVDPNGELKRTQPVPAPGPFFLLDIDSFWLPGESIPEFDAKELLTICDDLHEPVRSLFERLISDRLRNEVLRRAD